MNEGSLPGTRRKARAHGRWTAVLGYEGIAAATPDSPSSEPGPSDQDAGFGRIGVNESRLTAALAGRRWDRLAGKLDDDLSVRTENRHRRRHAGGSTSRTEEHTSEHQSLMSISYAVFCLKKKTKKL